MSSASPHYRRWAESSGSSPEMTRSSMDFPPAATHAYRPERLGARASERESTMLRRATSIRPLAMTALLLAAIPRVAEAASPPDASAVSAPITPSPGAQAPGGAGLKIADAVELALTRNERARISDLNVVVADAAVEKARAGFLPILTFNGNDTGTAVRAAGQPALVGTGSVVLTQPLLNASAYPLYAQAKALAEAQRAQNTDDKLVLAFNATTRLLRRARAQAQSSTRRSASSRTRRPTRPIRRRARRRSSRAPTT